MNEFIFCSSTYSLSHLHLKDTLVESWIPDLKLLTFVPSPHFNVVKMLLHCLLVGIVSSEEFTIQTVLVPLYVSLFFHCLLLNFSLPFSIFPEVTIFMVGPLAIWKILDILAFPSSICAHLC